MNRAIVVLAQINDIKVHHGAWIIKAYSQNSIVEGMIH